MNRFSADELSSRLQQGLDSLKITATAEQQKQLLLLLDQLVKWNKTYNLTAIDDPMDGLTLHLLDSLAVAPFINQSTLLDVGTGAGFPGLPLAILLPNVQFTLLDSNSKKIRFILQQIHLLNLANVTAIHSRVESAQHDRFDAIISRAFASIQDMVHTTKHLLSEDGRWLAMKGQYSKQEVESVVPAVKELACHMLTVPGLTAERCLIELVKAE